MMVIMTAEKARQDWYQKKAEKKLVRCKGESVLLLLCAALFKRFVGQSRRAVDIDSGRNHFRASSSVDDEDRR